MPTYDKVSDAPQLPKTRSVPPAAVRTAPDDPLVPITTDIPASIRRELKVALAVHDVKLKDAVAEALTLWLATKKDV
jgi:hypothetical protein